MTPGGRRSIAMVTAAFAIAAVATAAPRQPSVTTRAGEPTAAPSESAAAKTAIESGPAKDWIFPVFSDKEGYRLYTLRGSEIRYKNANEIDVAGFSAVVFSGDASERVDTVLLSPQATFYPRENRASGNDAVRLILSGRPDTPNDDVEVTGRGWTYNHGSKKVSIAHEVRVTFHAQLNDILK